MVGELLGGALDRAEFDPSAGVEQGADHLHRVLALLVCLREEELGEPRKRLAS